MKILSTRDVGRGMLDRQRARSEDIWEEVEVVEDEVCQCPDGSLHKNPWQLSRWSLSSPKGCLTRARKAMEESSMKVSRSGDVKD